MNVRFVLHFEQITIIPQSYSAKHEQSFSRKSIRFFECGLGATKQIANYKERYSIYRASRIEISVCFRFFPFNCTPADIMAIKAFRPINQFYCLIGFLLRLFYRFSCCSNIQNPAAIGDDFSVF